ncbi:superoxide dismutase [Thermodesulforhabdus norvegica]|uniref:superoxide dismutase n=1 Tax=Thermodesulforhabdus norvegica TaxID=39841 RepID=A0A1I4RAD5_9BACT|nr:superoxide dismutase [Thermodesulforhabdus norvegica]SFM48996.1 superoxide dismutase, Fe-Mn family [Thermodesulforhabdus norvegica]
MKRLFLLLLLTTVVCMGLAGCKEKAAKPASDTGKIRPYSAKDFSYLLGTPGFSDNALKLHFALYEGYVKNTNLLLTKMEEMVRQGKSQSSEFSELKRRFGFEFNGMRLHEYYFSSLGGNGIPDKESDLYKAIVASFGSFENWQKDFVDTAMSRGVGWTVLYYDEIQNRLMNVWINEHHVGHPAGCRVILPLDVFEHAFLVDYGLDKKAYIEAFLKALNWKVLEERFRGQPFPERPAEVTEKSGQEA